MIPKKVKQGEFLENRLRVTTTLQESFDIAWESIALLFTGKVEENQKSAPPPKSGINVIRVTAALTAGPIGTAAYDLAAGKKKDVPRTKENRYWLLDLYVKDQREPFRFDSVGTNFRTFLGDEAGYSGETNFFTFIRKLFPKINQAEPRKTDIPTFPSRDEFAWASFKKCFEKGV